MKKLTADDIVGKYFSIDGWDMECKIVEVVYNRIVVVWLEGGEIHSTVYHTRDAIENIQRGIWKLIK